MDEVAADRGDTGQVVGVDLVEARTVAEDNGGVTASGTDQRPEAKLEIEVVGEDCSPPDQVVLTEESVASKRHPLGHDAVGSVDHGVVSQQSLSGAEQARI